MSMLGIALGKNWHTRATSKAKFTPPRKPVTYHQKLTGKYLVAYEKEHSL
jgi:hypothetical protein